MKKLFLFTWMMMLSIVAMAQTIMVIDKDGNRIPYDPAKVSSVDFQVTPPGFTVNHEVGSDGLARLSVCRSQSGACLSGLC